MRTPGHPPSVSLSCWARPRPPRSSTRRVFRPWPIPRKRDRLTWGPRNGPHTPNARKRPGKHGALLVHRSRPDLLVGESGALAGIAEVDVVFRAQRLHVVGLHQRAEVGLVHQLVHRHVLVGILAEDRAITPGAHHALPLEHLWDVLLVVPAVEGLFAILANGGLDDEQDGGPEILLRRAVSAFSH